MTEFDGTLSLILTGACLVLLLVILVLIVHISSRMGRLEGQVRQGTSRGDAAAEKPSEAESSVGGAFELFLSEDPARHELSKGEQFSAYRKWRQEKGMNWSNS